MLSSVPKPLTFKARISTFNYQTVRILFFVNCFCDCATNQFYQFPIFFLLSPFKASLPTKASLQDIRRAEGKAGLPSIPLYCFSLPPLTWNICFIDRNMPNRLSPISLTIIVQLIFGLLTKTVISTTYVFKFGGMATNFKFTRQCWVQFQNL